MLADSWLCKHTVSVLSGSLSSGLGGHPPIVAPLCVGVRGRTGVQVQGHLLLFVDCLSHLDGAFAALAVAKLALCCLSTLRPERLAGRNFGQLVQYVAMWAAWCGQQSEWQQSRVLTVLGGPLTDAALLLQFTACFCFCIAAVVFVLLCSRCFSIGVCPARTANPCVIIMNCARVELREGACWGVLHRAPRGRAKHTKQNNHMYLISATFSVPSQHPSLGGRRSSMLRSSTLPLAGLQASCARPTWMVTKPPLQLHKLHVGPNAMEGALPKRLWCTDKQQPWWA